MRPMQALLQDSPLTLQWIVRRLEQVFPNRALVSARKGTIARRRSYRDLACRAQLLASALQRAGIAPGERVATFSHNSDDHLEQMLGIACSGRVFHALNPRLAPSELSYIVDQAQDALVFVDCELLPAWHRIGALKSIRRIVAVAPPGEDADTQGHEDYESFLRSVDEQVSWPDVAERAPAALCYTSGTTGPPKGVVYSHRGLMLIAIAWMTADAMAVSERDTFLPAVPLFHAQAWGLPFSALLAGSPIVLAGTDVSPTSLARLIESERVTLAAGVPTLWSDMLTAVDAGLVDAAALRSLDRIACGGSAVPRAMFEHFDVLGVQLIQVWGMTEMSPLGTVSRVRAEVESAEALDRRAMQGLPQPLVDLRIVDAEGNELPWNGENTGELQASGPWIADAYFDPHASDRRTDVESFATGADGRRWLRTGDIASIDSLAYVRLVDRAKDLVKSGGEWISSVFLEQVINTHPAVKSSAVIAVRHERWGERPLAIVELMPGACASCGEVRAFVGARVASWQVPDDVVFVGELPRTTVGKLDKQLLRAQYESMFLSTADDQPLFLRQ